MFRPTFGGSGFDVFLASPEFQADPYDALRQLRENDPVYWCEPIGAWIVTRFDDCMRTYLEVDAYSNEGRLAGTLKHLPAEEQEQLADFTRFYRAKGLIHSDPPDHTRLRRLITKAGFSASQVEALRPKVEVIVDELLAETAARGSMNVIDDLAAVLPMTVLCDLLGVPHADGNFFRPLADRLLGFQGRNKPSLDSLLAAQQGIRDLRVYLDAAPARFADGTNDPDALLGRLFAARDDADDPLGEDELVNTVGTLLIAGHETTTSLIGNGLYTLLRHRDQWELLCSNPALLPQATEEMLRYESPLTRQPRLMKADAELGGKTIRAGETVFHMMNGANRDPEHFANPETFDITVPRGKHLAFGQGIHFCLGAPLARLEGSVVFAALIERMPHLQLAEPAPNWVTDTPTVRTLDALHVAF